MMHPTKSESLPAANSQRPCQARTSNLIKQMVIAIARKSAKKGVQPPFPNSPMILPHATKIKVAWVRTFKVAAMTSI